MTARHLRIVLLSLVLSAVIPAKAGSQERSLENDRAKNPPQAAGDTGTEDSDSVVDVSSVYSISPQPGLIDMSAAFHSDGRPVESSSLSLSMIESHCIKDRQQNAFLVPGDIDSAVLTTLRVVLGEVTPDTIKSYHVGTSGTWLYLFLGNGSSVPTSWVLEKIALQGDSILVAYNAPRYNKYQIHTLDVRPYLYWAPLGGLAAGNYLIRLLDTTKDSVTFERVVAIY